MSVMLTDSQRAVVEDQGGSLLVSAAAGSGKTRVLVDRLWSGGGEYVDENALSVTVNRLRSKLEDRKDAYSCIRTVYGQGYMWKKE